MGEYCEDAWERLERAKGANVKGCWGNCKEAQGETETVKSSRDLL